jgi:acyl-coenzyme A thioesterase PaaI-like protein
MTPELVDDRMCYACGKKNAVGLKLAFERPETGRLLSEVTFKKEHQGYKDIVHGGLVATVLDEMMVNLAWLQGTPAMTAELTVRLKKPVPVGQKVLLEGLLEPGEGSGRGKLLRMRATAKSPAGVLYADAQAKCLRLPGGPVDLAGRGKEG